MTQIKLRRDTSAAFASSNPILGNGEPAYETDTKKLKIGDGTTAYTQLEYFSTDLDKLNISKMYKTGEISTDTIGYNQLVQMKHSTFDKSKFTVVGSPTITDDGIASGFSNRNYLTGSFTAITPSKIIFRTKTVYSSTPNAANGSQTIGKIQGTKSTPSIEYLPSTNRLSAIRFHNDSSTDNSSAKIIVPLNDGDIVETEVIATSASVTLNAKINGVLYTNTWSGNGLYCGAINGYLISNNSKGYWTGSIDLKAFSITVDGKEVFSGNKTGIDTIKADNYEVVGSPVISDDGVASGFSATTNYLKTSTLNITPKQSLEINCNFKLASSQSSKVVFALTNNLRLTVSTSSIAIVGNTYTTTNLSLENIVDKTVNFYIKITPTNQYLKAVVNGNTYEQSFNNTFGFYTIDLGYIGGQYGNGNYSLDGSIDLNAFKIYVDGNLVYQPCLKIPYTETAGKYGSKIVDVAYRDRVIDCYEQNYPQKYYTIDETNQNFTLPMGEIYGMIGQRSLISSTVTETNRVDVYSDKTCLICGNVATAGTINLPIELANNNYFITLSTSAKTTTSFTTTATGDYILIGEVI